MSLLSVGNIVGIFFVLLFIYIYINHDTYSRSVDKIISITNSTGWNANIFNCRNSSDIYLSCDIVKSNITMIDIHPLCSNSRNEMCNITVNYFITFKIIRGFIHKDGVQETLNKQTKCPLENYNICLQYAIHAMSWLSDVTYYTNYPNIYAMTASDPNYRFYIFLIVVIVLFSCLELLCLWMCCCNIRYYYSNSFLQRERNLKVQQTEATISSEEQKRKLLDIIIETKEKSLQL